MKLVDDRLSWEAGQDCRARRSTIPMATPGEEGNVGNISWPGSVTGNREGDRALDPEVRQVDGGQEGRRNKNYTYPNS